MKTRGYKVKIGIVGCGAIGSRMAITIHKDFTQDCRITGLYDTVPSKAQKLNKKLGLPRKVVSASLKELIQRSDCVVEATSAQNTHDILHQSLSSGKSVLAMSVGKLLHSEKLYSLARKKKCYVLLPSGAIAGIDAIKAASLAKIRKITLTTRKPIKNFGDNPYFKRKNIDLSKIKKETVLFEGRVSEAVRNFPQNINVAATIALASHIKKKFIVKIITSPKYKLNSHEIELEGDFGKIRTRTENVVCPDNPKTSYLAVLSGLQTLKQYCSGILIGT